MTPQTSCPNDHASQPLRRLSLVLLLTVDFPSPFSPDFDVDGDEVITVVDVQTFAAQWGWPLS